MWSLKLLQYISSPTRRLQKHVWGHEWSKWWVNKPTNNLGRTHSVLADDALCVQTSNWPSSSPGDVAAPGVSCTCFLLCVLFCWCFFFFLVDGGGFLIPVSLCFYPSSLFYISSSQAVRFTTKRQRESPISLVANHALDSSVDLCLCPSVCICSFLFPLAHFHLLFI